MSSSPVSKKWQLSLLNHASIFEERLTLLLDQEDHASATFRLATQALQSLPAVHEVNSWSNEKCCRYCDKGHPFWSNIAPVVKVLTLVAKRTSQELWEDLLGNYFKRYALMTADELQNGSYCGSLARSWWPLSGKSING